MNLNRINQMTSADFVVRNDEATGSIPVSSTIFRFPFSRDRNPVAAAKFFHNVAQVIV